MTLDRTDAAFEFTKVIVVLLRTIVEGVEEVPMQVLGDKVETADDLVLPVPAGLNDVILPSLAGAKDLILPLFGGVVQLSNRLHKCGDVGLRGWCR